MTASALATVLAAGPLSGSELREKLAVSQPTLSRVLERARSEVARLGRGRATRYALYRAVRDLAPEVPVYRIAVDGDARQIGVLVAIRPDRFWYEDSERPRQSREFASLPWFMTDIRPQGYLGRQFPRTYQDLALPERVDHWNEDQALYAIARRGEDAAGNLIVGAESYARWLGQTSADPPLGAAERARRFDEMAALAVAGYAAGSSAAGEQPKFTARVAPEGTADARHVIVKFSGILETHAARRWADLLLAEHLAGVVLREYGHVAARSEFLSSARRAYLQVERFDREAMRGRRGLVSLGALDDEFVGERRGWPESAAALLRAGIISADDARELRWLSAFGRLIGNTDMHLGNASFLTDGGDPTLAPAYDMLPMLFAPVRDEVQPRRFVRPDPLPGHADQWLAALPVARAYWRRVADEQRASEELRDIAREAGRELDA